MIYQRYDEGNRDMTTGRAPLGTWRKSSYSLNEDSYCVEVADFPDSVGVRDSKNRQLAHLTFASGGWSAFLGSVKAGRFSSAARSLTAGD